MAYLGTDNVSRVDVSFDAAQPLSFVPPGDNATACPAAVPAANCSGFAVLGSDGGVYPAATANLTGNGTLLTLTAILQPDVYAVGSQYAWGAWPLALLFSAGGGTATPGDPGSLPVLPWSQGLELDGPPPPPPTVVRIRVSAALLGRRLSLRVIPSQLSVRPSSTPPMCLSALLQHVPSGLCLVSNASDAYPCPSGWGNSCPAFLGPCDGPMARWGVSSAAALISSAPTTLASLGVPGACINVDCDKCEPHRVAKLADCSNAVPFAFNASAGTLAYTGGGCSGLCLDGGEGPAVPPCEPGEFFMSEGQAQLTPCADAAAAAVWALDEEV